MKRREAALDPVVSPEEIISREVELGKLQAPVYDILQPLPYLVTP